MSFGFVLTFRNTAARAARLRSAPLPGELNILYVQSLCSAAYCDGTRLRTKRTRARKAELIGDVSRKPETRTNGKKTMPGNTVIIKPRVVFTDSGRDRRLSRRLRCFRTRSS